MDDTIKKEKSQPTEWEKTFQNFIYNKVLRIDKELLQLYNKRTIIQLKTGKGSK